MIDAGYSVLDFLKFFDVVLLPLMGNEIAFALAQYFPVVAQKLVGVQHIESDLDFDVCFLCFFKLGTRSSVETPSDKLRAFSVLGMLIFFVLISGSH